LIPINENLEEIVKKELEGDNAELLLSFIRNMNSKSMDKSELCTL